MKMEHDWIVSRLGHGNFMCRDCSITDLEAAAIRKFKCDRAPKAEEEGKDDAST